MTQDELITEITDYIRSYEFMDGNHYEAAEELALAIEENYLSKDTEGYNGRGPTFL